ncbi:hypothetical protein HHX47_DHR3000296 [Lentinula edodes]|nr:hypothetical protein HHX47_DHR3000296 [Lentinula edodes]
MTTFLYDLSTTGAISFSDIINDPTNSFTRRLSEATQMRSRLRGALKESKRTDGEKDYLTIIKMITFLNYRVSSTVSHTMSSSSNRNLLENYTFRKLPEQLSSLLTYAFALSNLARTIVTSLGPFEHDRAISQAERETKEEKLKHATGHLSRASGIFTYLSETVLPELQHSASAFKSKLPPDLSPEVNTALARMSLADAQTLAIRKLLSKSFYDSNIAPGPPLPKSHPAPSLIAKLHLECASLYSSARTLAKTPSASSKSAEDVSPELRHYLGDEALLHSALAKKWFGIDAGENGGEDRGGDAVGLLIWAQKELQELKDGGKGVGLSRGEKEKRDRNLRKEKVTKELEITGVWLKHYKKINDTVHFKSIPSQADLQSRLSSGVSAVFATPYSLPEPMFGPGSGARVQKEQDTLDREGSMGGSASSTYAVRRITLNYSGYSMSKANQQSEDLSASQTSPTFSAGPEKQALAFDLPKTNGTRFEIENPALDEVTLTRLNASGHIDQLQRQYSLLSICSTSVTIDCAWVAMGGSIVVGLSNGGPPGIIWELLILAALPRHHASAASVFTTWDNQTGWPSGVAFLTGMLNGAYTIGTPDAITHIAEELPNPKRDLPKAIAAQMVIGTLTSFAFAIVIMFAITDLDAVLNTGRVFVGNLYGRRKVLVGPRSR